jgi:tetratricopeptide (TPR) repeat protein
MQTTFPESREALYRLAVSHRRAGRITAALLALKRIEELYPPFGSLFEELGFCLVAADDRSKAALAFARAAELNPCLIESWRALERLFTASGRTAQAQQAASQVAELAALPGEIQLACSKFFDGERVVAEDLVRQYLTVHGEHVEALRLLAKMASDAGAEYDSEVLLHRAVSLAPDHLAARHELVLALLKRQKHDLAREHIAKLLASAPTHPVYRALYAEAMAGMGDYNKALPVYGELLREDPQDAELYVTIGNALKTTGKTDEAIDAYHYATTTKPGFGAPFWGLANLKTYRFTDAEITLMQQHEVHKATAAEDRCHLCFALGKALEDRGRFAEAFEYYERGNALKKASLKYSPEALEQSVRQQMSGCAPEFFAARRNFGSPSAAPIFIVGMPRSGSTLVEQILASHSQVDGTLELADIPRLAQEMRSGDAGVGLSYQTVLQGLTAAMARKLGERYLSDTRPYRTGRAGAPRPRFTDKMPNNFQHLDLIQLLLPNAKVIDVRREPVACGFGIFKQLFANGQRFAYSQEDIGRYYRMYVELMAHWERALPGKILRVQYEDLVKDLEPNVRRILDFCELEFEPACVEFHRTRRSVHTPSSEQVHQPIYREGLDQWQHFERWLAPLKRTLAG